MERRREAQRGVEIRDRRRGCLGQQTFDVVLEGANRRMLPLDVFRGRRRRRRDASRHALENREQFRHRPPFDGVGLDAAGFERNAASAHDERIG